ncbi:unnamed protein product [Dicrocoelium dendriticum]|nr:unnamed protein product [Dicrocoelium dendriticum]
MDQLLLPRISCLGLVYPPWYFAFSDPSYTFLFSTTSNQHLCVSDYPTDTMSQTTVQRLQQGSVVLTDLDGLLVNAENFNQVFIQRIDAEWMTSTINRVVKSELHLHKLVQVLIKYVVSEIHPDWSYHALAWLTHLFESPVVPRFPMTATLRKSCGPLLSYAAEMSGLRDLYSQAALRATVAEKWAASSSRLPNGVPHNFYYGGLFDIPSTGYVYVDDSDEDFGQRSSRLRGKRRTQPPPTDLDSASSQSHIVMEQSDVSDEDGYSGDRNIGIFGSESDDDDELVSGPEFVVGTDDESDHGVFDVNETASSEHSLSQEQLHRAEDTAWMDGLPGTDLFSNVTSSKYVPQSEQSDEENETVDQDSSEEEEELDLLMWARQEEDERLESEEPETSSTESERDAVEARSPSTPKRKRPITGSNTLSDRKTKKRAPDRNRTRSEKTDKKLSKRKRARSGK